MNPFDVGFGKVPKIFLDRSELVETTLKALKDENSLFQTSLVYGMRGSGKTSFMTEVSEKLAKDDKWLTIDLSISDGLIEDFADYLEKESKTNQALAASIQSLGLSAFGLSASFSRKEEGEAAKIKIESLLEQLTKKNISLLLTIDEVTNTKAVREFASFYQVLVRKKFKIAILLAGLPENINQLITHDVLTFLLRANKILLPTLGDYSIMDSYLKTFGKGGRQISSEVLTKMAAYVKGYAYAFQLLGYLLWNQTENKKRVTDKDLEAVLPTYQAYLFQNVYTLMYRQFTGQEKLFLKVMAQNDVLEVPSAYLVEELGKTKAYVNVYRDRLLKSQVLTSPERGQLTFSLPYFKDFLLQQAALEAVEI
ncbi:ATP-binding protein [Streptococcus sobrinus]|uniref:ATPase domain-containing protein n=2 Tax=Bacteria TaxID=2 RepID=U2J3G1_9STRE|nr:ATP-binding protein [Streptococcus sobrinus]ERJ74557.1 hypothetical protein HMPREF1557_01563 [Streptococcus sobrinus W1703]OZV24187.1 ATP-binding protein [Streptococcus sobrinus]